MQIDVNLGSITAFAEFLTTAPYPYYEELREAFIVLLLTGCRPNELFEINRWSVISDYTVSLLPQKGNTTRSCVLDSRCDNFLAAIQGQYSPFLGRTIYQFQNLYQQIREWGILNSGSKVITAYLYRYRFIWQLSADGYSLSQIASTMGYVESMTPQAYLSASIKLEVSVPPLSGISIGSQIWLDRNLSFDDGGSGIKHVNGDAANDYLFGLLYTHEAAVRVAALYPSWHLPVHSEVTTLLTALEGQFKAGGHLKDTSLDYWNTPNRGADNSSGFSGRGSGVCSTSGETFSLFKQSLYLWEKEPYSPTLDPVLAMNYNSAGTAYVSFTHDYYCSVRFVYNG